MAMVFMDGEGTTSAGNAVIMSIIPWINKAKKKKTNALRFDALLALTYALLQHDMCMHDNELYGPGKWLNVLCIPAVCYYLALLFGNDGINVGWAFIT